MSSLTSLLDTALTIILEHLDFKSILTLRHTCHDLRNFIDDVKPNSNVRSIHISIGTESIHFVFYAEVRFSKTYKEVNFPERFLKDLEIILSFQRAPLNYMNISFDYRHPTDQFISLEKISKILKLRPRPLSVTFLNLVIFNQEDVMSVLPFIKTEKIHIFNARKGRNVLELNKVVELDQWKQAKEIDIRNLDVVESLHHFLNFDDIFVQVETVSLEDVVRMRDKFLHSSTTSCIRIEFDELINRNRLEEVLGPKLPDYGNNWFIPIENSEFEVSIDLIKYQILFERSPRTIYNLASHLITPTNFLVPAPCLHTSKSTFFFAYSNDVEPGIVENAAKLIEEVAVEYIQSGNIRFWVLASVRFDVNKKNEQIYYNTSGPGFYDSVLNNLPDPKLSFSSPGAGSDILEVIEKFLDNAVAPVCGSVVFILAKRYPDTSDTSRLLTRLRNQHVSLQTFISSNATGGTDKQTLYDLSVKTNGFCGFAENLTDADVTTIFMTNYLFYAVNPTVAGVGTVELPAALLSEADIFNQGVWVFMEINVQSHPLDDSFQSVQILMYDQKIDHTEVVTFERGTWKLKKPYHTFDLYDTPTIRLGRKQRMTLNYNYTNSMEQNLQIRMFTAYDNLPWYPYSN